LHPTCSFVIENNLNDLKINTTKLKIILMVEQLSKNLMQKHITLNLTTNPLIVCLTFLFYLNRKIQ